MAEAGGDAVREAAGLPGVVEAAGRRVAARRRKAEDHSSSTARPAACGIAAIQLAVARGATVIGTASERNHDFLRSLGAIPVTYGEGLADRVRAVAPQGIDLALDTAGRGAVADLITLTAVPADVVSIADFDAPKLGARVTDGSEGRAWQTLDEAAALTARAASRCRSSGCSPCPRPPPATRPEPVRPRPRARSSSSPDLHPPGQHHPGASPPRAGRRASAPCRAVCVDAVPPVSHHSSAVRDSGPVTDRNLWSWQPRTSVDHGLPESGREMPQIRDASFA